LISEEDPLLAAALLAAQAEDEENLYDGYQQDEDGMCFIKDKFFISRNRKDSSFHDIFIDKMIRKMRIIRG